MPSLVKSALVAVLTVLTLAYVALPWAGAWLVPSLLARWDVTVSEVELGWPGWRSVAVRRLNVVHADARVSISDARVHYCLRGLLAGHVDAVIVRRMAIELIQGEQPRQRPPDVAALLALASPRVGLPLRRAEVSNLELRAQSPRVTASGALLLDGDTLELVLDVEAEPVALPFALRARSRGDGQLALGLTERGAQAEVVSLRVLPDASGDIQVEIDLMLDGAPLRALLERGGLVPSGGYWAASLVGRWPAQVAARPSMRGLLSGVVTASWDAAFVATIAATAGRLDIAGAGRARASNGRAEVRMEPGSRLDLELEEAALAALSAVGVRRISARAPDGIDVLVERSEISSGSGWDLSLFDADEEPAAAVHLEGVRGSWNLEGLTALGGSARIRVRHPASGAHGSGTAHFDWAPEQVRVRFDPGTRVAWSHASPGWQLAPSSMIVSDAVPLQWDVTRGLLTVGTTKLIVEVPELTVAGRQAAVKDAKLSVVRAGWDPASGFETVGTLEFAPAIDGLALAPMLMEATAAFAGARLSATVQVQSPGGRWALPATLTHDFQTGLGTLSAAAAWLSEVPLLGTSLAAWTGAYELERGLVDLALRGSWALNGTAADYRFDAQIGIEDGHVRYDESRLHGVAGRFDVAVDRSGTRVPDTVLGIERAELGLPLRSVQGTIALREGVLSVRDLNGATLGGRFRIPAVDYDVQTASSSFVVDIDGVLLRELLALHGDEIHGTGVLDGSVPVRIDAGALSASGGRVRARAPGGRLRYASAAHGLFTDQPGLDFALRALGDFSYTELEADVDYAADGTLALAVRLLGNNPAVEAGRPIQYNLQLTQSVPDLLRSLRLSDQLTDHIERHIRR
jgi:hypothetical protein